VLLAIGVGNKSARPRGGLPGNTRLAASRCLLNKRLSFLLLFLSAGSLLVLLLDLLEVGRRLLNFDERSRLWLLLHNSRLLLWTLDQTFGEDFTRIEVLNRLFDR
jgi:hypothetical protein